MKNKTPKIVVCSCGHSNAMHAGYFGNCAFPACKCKEFSAEKPGRSSRRSAVTEEKEK